MTLHVFFWVNARDLITVQLSLFVLDRSQLSISRNWYLSQQRKGESSGFLQFGTQDATAKRQLADRITYNFVLISHH